MTPTTINSQVISNHYLVSVSRLFRVLMHEAPTFASRAIVWCKQIYWAIIKEVYFDLHSDSLSLYFVSHHPTGRRLWHIYSRHCSRFVYLPEAGEKLRLNPRKMKNWSDQNITFLVLPPGEREWEINCFEWNSFWAKQSCPIGRRHQLMACFSLWLCQPTPLETISRGTRILFLRETTHLKAERGKTW